MFPHIFILRFSIVIKESLRTSHCVSLPLPLFYPCYLSVPLTRPLSFCPLFAHSRSVSPFSISHFPSSLFTQMHTLLLVAYKVSLPLPSSSILSVSLVPSSSLPLTRVSSVFKYFLPLSFSYIQILFDSPAYTRPVPLYSSFHLRLHSFAHSPYLSSTRTLPLPPITLSLRSPLTYTFSPTVPPYTRPVSLSFALPPPAPFRLPSLPSREARRYRGRRRSLCRSRFWARQDDPLTGAHPAFQEARRPVN